MHKIFCFNVNGIRALEKSLDVPFNDWLLQQDADMFCFQEIKGSKQNLSRFFSLNDFNTFASFHKRPGRHGVATFIKKTAFCSKTEEIVPGRILKSYHSGFVLYNVYMPYFGGEEVPSEIMDVYDTLKESMDKDTDTIMLCGDINACYNMSDTYLYQQEYKKLQYVTEWNTDIKYKSDIHNFDQKQKVYTPEYFDLLMDQSTNKIYTEKINPKVTELSVVYLTVHELYKFFMRKPQRKWLADLCTEFIDVFRLNNKKIEQYTCWDVSLGLRRFNKGSRIDYFLLKTDKKYKIHSAEIKTDIFGSDHAPITLEIELEDTKCVGPNIAEKKNNLLDYLNP